MTRATVIAALVAASFALPQLAHADAPLASIAAPKKPEGDGTTIVGDRETAVGLYLMPWQEEGPAGTDRPPVRFDEAPVGADAAATLRRMHSEEAFAAYRRSRTERQR